MACADDDPNCMETLQHLDQFMDGAMTLDRLQQLQAHLEECPPCLEQFVLQQDLRWTVADACGCQHAPETLRQRILSEIVEVRVATFTTPTATAVTWEATTRLTLDQ